jgi:3-deoxy-7-phosphoheptulonate synthase
MIVVMQAGASGGAIARVTAVIEQAGYRVHISENEGQLLVGAVGNGRALDSESLLRMEGVEKILPMSRTFKLTSREFHPQDTVIRVGEVIVGGPAVVMMAGPCAVESREQTLTTARAVRAAGARILRGGAFKPRSSPYSFRGLGEEGLQILAEAGRETGMPIITEVMSPEQVPLVCDYADLLQVGARNMQNFDLLSAVGQVRRPVLLKRGLMSTIEELLMAAEYIMAQGNYQVILCERGIRTFETYTRNTLDLSAVPVLKQLSHLPVVVDPSHAAGRWELVTPMALSAVAAGADGLIVEVHPEPARALSDGPQSLKPARFAALMERVQAVAQAIGRTG